MPNIAEIFNEALAALQNKKLEKAEELFKRVIKLDKSNVPALNLLVIVLMSMDRFAEAEPFIARATSLNTQSDVSFYNFGLISKRLNKPQQALENFSKALNLKPIVAETWNNRGTVLNELKRYDAAISDFDKAISLNALYSEAYVNKGNSLTSLKRHDEAAAAFEKALSIKPDFAEAWLGRGNVFSDLRRHDEALAAYDKALSIKPDLDGAWLGRGNVLYNQKRHDEALGTYDKALSIKSDLDGAWLGRGNVLYSLKRYDDALAAYDKALSVKPDSDGAWLGRGNVFFDLKRYDEAFAAYDKALALNPHLENAWLGRGHAFYEIKRYDEAFAAYEKALSINPDLESAWLGRGHAFSDLKRYDEAFAAYDKALSINPDLDNAWVGRGYAHFALNKDSDALRCLDKAIELKRDHAEAHWAKAFVNLSLGEYAEGWPLYEWRWKTRAFTSPNRNFSQPLWLNDFDIGGKTLLVHAEQGLGDTIHFCRYVERLEDSGARVLFEVQKSLAPLLKIQGWNCEILSQGDPLPAFDAHCPLMSLPLAFGTTLETIPKTVPYLRASEGKRFDLEDAQTDRSKIRIGVAWSGNADFAKGNDTRRPISLSALGSIMDDGRSWYRLQKDLRDSDKDALAQLPQLKDYSSSFTSFWDTANLIEQMDLVLSIDTSVAHLAGAMGKPVWVLLPFHPDFRWLRERTDSPWYPTARLYRQTRDGDWTDVLERIAVDMKTFRSNGPR